MKIIDLQGHLIKTLINNEIKAPGVHLVHWKGDFITSGKNAGPGVYFAILEVFDDQSKYPHDQTG